jgi:hypothetical protein
MHSVFISKLTALIVFSSVIFNGLSFFAAKISSDDFCAGVSASFNAVTAAANPLNVVGDLMKKARDGKEKPQTSQDKSDALLDMAQNAPAVCLPSWQVLKIRFLPDSFDFPSLNAGIFAHSGAPPGLTETAFAGEARLFYPLAFLLMYLAVLRRGLIANKVLSVNKNAAA